MGDPNDNLSVKDHRNSVGNNDNKNAEDHLGVGALIAIMEPATESQAFRAPKQPLQGYPSTTGLRVRRRPLFSTKRKRLTFFLPD